MHPERKLNYGYQNKCKLAPSMGKHTFFYPALSLDILWGTLIGFFRCLFHMLVSLKVMYSNYFYLLIVKRKDSWEIIFVFS